MKDWQQEIVRGNMIVEEIRHASETWGFFQVVNHVILKDVMDDMIEGVRRFHEQPKEVKMEYYSRNEMKKVKYNSNFDLHNAKVANWRDTLYFLMAPDAPNPDEIPSAYRDITIKHSVDIIGRGHTLLEALSEALGLKPNHLIDIDCAKGQFMVRHYNLSCPEPDRALGTTSHKDPSFITILLQDLVVGLQVHHQNQQVDIPPIPGAFVVIGDLLQLISNDKLKSAEHRVLANRIGPRISVARFFTTLFYPLNRFYGPIKELLSDGSPPLYREILVTDYILQYNSKGLAGCGTYTLDHFRLQNSDKLGNIYL